MSLLRRKSARTKQQVRLRGWRRPRTRVAYGLWRRAMIARFLTTSPLPLLRRVFPELLPPFEYQPTPSARIYYLDLPHDRAA